MKLPISFSFGKKEIKNYYLALLLQDEKVGSVIFEETAGKIHVISRAEEHFSTSLEEAPFEEWLDIVDKAVSIAEETLPENVQTEKTVFGVKQEWIEDGKIKKEYLLKLKKVCDELELQPIGFLVFTEAIIHLLQQEEGAPVSAILVELGKKIIDISIIRAGRIVATKQIPYRTPVPHAVDEALKHFNDIEIFPSRIILFDSKQNEHNTQSFIGHSWSKSLPFLHMPQITILPQGFDTKGILVGTATQMGFEIAQQDMHIPIKTHTVAEEGSKKFITEKTISEEPEAPDGIPVPDESTADATVKFPLEETKPVEYAIQEEIDTAMHEETVNADYFGFIKNKDITNSFPDGKKKTPVTPVQMEAVAQVIEEIPEEVKDEVTQLNKSDAGLPVNSMLLFEGIKTGLAKINLKGIFQKKRKPLHQQPSEPVNKKTFNRKLLFIPLLFLAGAGILLAYILLIKAVVTLTISPKVLENKQSVTFAVGGSSDFSKNVIAATEEQSQEQGSLTADATGTKQVGTQSKGILTIFSRLTSSQSIPKNTVVSASNSLQFTLDNPVNVASFSGDTTDPSVTVSNIPITAKNIGPESNLPSGTKFSINGLSTSDISAKNDAPFTGGTKKDVTVVSQKDVDTAVSTLTKNLSDKANASLSSNQSGDKILLPFFTKQDITKKTLSKNVGDEAKSFNLDAVIVFYGASYSKNEINAYATSLFKDSIPSGSTLAKNGLQTTVTDVKQDKNTVSASLDAKASIMPTIDTTAIASGITGKTFTEAQNQIKSNPQISSVDIHLKPNIPFLPKLLPKFSKNIQVITANE